MKEKVNPHLEHPFAHPPASGDGLEVAPGLYWLRLPIPFELNHINVWLLEEERGFTLVDTGIDSTRTREAWEGLLKNFLRGKPVICIIITHFHPDHFGLARWLQNRFNAEYMCSMETRQHTDFLLNGDDSEFADGRGLFYEQHAIVETSLFEDFLRGKMYEQIVSGNPCCQRELEDGECLQIGGREWQVIMAYGHAPGHITLYSSELNTLISGDQILPTITSNVSVYADEPDANPLAAFLGSLDRYVELPGNTRVLPSHGAVFCGLQTRLEQLKAHHREKLEKVEALCKSTHSVNTLMPKLFSRKLEGINVVLAFGETLANLNYLYHQGRLERKLRDGYYVFQS